MSMSCSCHCFVILLTFPCHVHVICICILCYSILFLIWILLDLAGAGWAQGARPSPKRNISDRAKTNQNKIKQKKKSAIGSRIWIPLLPISDTELGSRIRNPISNPEFGSRVHFLVIFLSLSVNIL